MDSPAPVTSPVADPLALPITPVLVAEWYDAGQDGRRRRGASVSPTPEFLAWMSRIAGHLTACTRQIYTLQLWRWWSLVRQRGAAFDDGALLRGWMLSNVRLRLAQHRIRRPTTVDAVHASTICLQPLLSAISVMSRALGHAPPSEAMRAWTSALRRISDRDLDRLLTGMPDPGFEARMHELAAAVSKARVVPATRLLPPLLPMARPTTSAASSPPRAAGSRRKTRATVPHRWMVPASPPPAGVPATVPVPPVLPVVAHRLPAEQLHAQLAALRDHAARQLHRFGGLAPAQLALLSVADLLVLRAGLSIRLSSDGMPRLLPRQWEVSQCPVVAVSHWLAEAGIVEGLVFRGILPDGRIQGRGMGVAALGEALARE